MCIVKIDLIDSGSVLQLCSLLYSHKHGLTVFGIRDFDW